MKKTVKKLLSLLLVLTMAVGIAPLSGFVGLKFPEIKLPEWDLFDFSVEAEETIGGSCGYGVNWSLSGHTLTIDGSGTMDSFAAGSLTPWYKYSDMIYSVRISSGVNNIGSYAFYMFSNITSVSIGNGVGVIGKYAFGGCSFLQRVSIPVSVTSIRAGAFSNCENLLSVTYGGSSADWNAISIGGFNNNLTSAQITYKSNSQDSEPKVYVTSILVWSSPQKEEYYVGETLDDTGVTVRVAYSNGKSETISSGFTCSPKVLNTVGSQTITVTYSGKTSSFDVIVKSPIEDVEICAYPEITNYFLNETLDVKGLILKEKYYNGDEKEIEEGFTCSVSVLDTYGEQKVEVYYKDKYAKTWILDFVVDVSYRGACDTIEDKLFWVLDPRGVLNISGNGNMLDYYANTRPWEDYKELIKSVVICDGITSVGRYAFYEYPEITSVVIGNDVTVIGNAAFKNCSKLKSVTLGSSLKKIEPYSFEKCKVLSDVYYTGDLAGWCDMEFGSDSPQTFSQCNIFDYVENFYINEELVSGEVVIPDGVSKIPKFAFYNCSKIMNLVIPASVKTIDEYAFIACNGLKKVTVGGGEYIDDNITRIEERAFYNCQGITTLVLGNNVSYIGNYAFYNCSSIREITMPVSAYIEQHFVFYNCNNVEKVFLTKGSGYMQNFKRGVYTTDPNDAPWNMNKTNLKELVLEEGILRIGSNAFSGIKLIESIPKSVTAIGDYAFRGCTNITSVILPDLTVIGYMAFSGCTGITEVLVPGSVEKVGESAFSGCTSLEKVSISEGVIEIGSYAFNGCVNLKSVCIPDSVWKIGSSAFDNCTSLEIVKVGKNVNIIEYNFLECNSLIDISVEKENGYFCDENGVLFNKHKTKLIKYPAANTRTGYVIPDGVQNISYRAFSGSEGLMVVTIPNSVTDIGSSAFKDCINLTDIYYCGTMEEWNAITVDSGENEFLMNAEIHFIGNHVHSYNSQIIKAETCSSMGEKIFVCSCGFSYVEFIQKVPHTEKAPIIESTVVSTCTESGLEYVIVYCSVCAEEVSRESVEIPALGHTESKSVKEKIIKAGCLTSGSYDSVVYCTVCDNELSRETIEIPAAGHTENEAVEENRKESACIVEGFYDAVIYCAVCKVELSRETKLIPSKGHRYGVWEVTTESTLTEQGEKIRSCSVCCEKDIGIVPATGIIVTVTNADDNVIKEEIVSGDLTEYSLSDVSDDKYTVTFAKETYATRTYTVSATDCEVSLEFTLNKLGDITSDGKVNTIDVARANAHAKSLSNLVDYDFSCADVNGDGKVNTIDVARMNSHAKSVTTLW